MVERVEAVAQRVEELLAAAEEEAMGRGRMRMRQRQREWWQERQTTFALSTRIEDLLRKQAHPRCMPRQGGGGEGA